MLEFATFTMVTLMFIPFALKNASSAVAFVKAKVAAVKSKI